MPDAEPDWSERCRDALARYSEPLLRAVAARLTPQEAEELLAIQGPNGPLARIGVDHYVELLERKRRLLQQAAAVAGTEYLGLLEQFVALLYDKVRPPPGR